MAAAGHLSLHLLPCHAPASLRCESGSGNSKRGSPTAASPLDAGIPLLCAHINLSPEADPTAVLLEVRMLSLACLRRVLAAQLSLRACGLAEHANTCPCNRCTSSKPILLPRHPLPRPPPTLFVLSFPLQLNEYCRSKGIGHSTIQLVVNGSACPCVC